MQRRIIGGEAVPEPRRRYRWIALALVLVAVLWSGGVATHRAQERVGAEVVPAQVIQHVRAAPLPKERATVQPREAVSDDGLDEAETALGLACVSIALAMIVLQAQKLPRGTPERRALAEAARPLRACLD